MKGKPKSGHKAPTGCKTHREIAKLLGISHGRVQQLEAQALRKMREEAIRLGWEP